MGGEIEGGASNPVVNLHINYTYKTFFRYNTKNFVNPLWYQHSKKNKINNIIFKIGGNLLFDR